LSYSVNFYLVVVLVSLVCVVEPWLQEGITKWDEWLGGRAWRIHAYLLRPLIYAFGLLLFLMFDDRNRQFIYFQF